MWDRIKITKSSSYPEHRPQKSVYLPTYNELYAIAKKPNAQAKSANAHIAFLPTLTEKKKFETDFKTYR